MEGVGLGPWAPDVVLDTELPRGVVGTDGGSGEVIPPREVLRANYRECTGLGPSHCAFYVLRFPRGGGRMRPAFIAIHLLQQSR